MTRDRYWTFCWTPDKRRCGKARMAGPQASSGIPGRIGKIDNFMRMRSWVESASTGQSCACQAGGGRCHAPGEHGRITHVHLDAVRGQGRAGAIVTVRKTMLGAHSAGPVFTNDTKPMHWATVRTMHAESCPYKPHRLTGLAVYREQFRLSTPNPTRPANCPNKGRNSPPV